MAGAADLRLELSERARAYAEARSLPYCLSYGEPPTVCFEADELGRHGNFHPASYRRILANPNWRTRLGKVHTTAARQLPRSENGRRRELDSCTSSDALLMNVFCYPGVLRAGTLRAMLSVDKGALPEFGVRAKVPLGNGSFDRTEADMCMGNLLVEAKLTESNFQRVRKSGLSGYHDFGHVFDETQLPQTEKEFTTYQLVRGILAAHAWGFTYCLLTDARRPRLTEAWYATVRCVKILDLRLRCKLLTWQEVAPAVPQSLQKFLQEKYGLEGQ